MHSSSVVVALKQWPWSAAPSVSPISQGLINESFVVRVDTQPVAVIQQLNTAIFKPSVHLDIAAVTAHLTKRGVRHPVLRPTTRGDLWWESPQGQVWRVLSYEGDQSFDRAPSPKIAHAAGRVVASFHGGLFDFEQKFQHVRPGAHDTHAHLRALEQSLQLHGRHRLYHRIEPLAEEIFLLAEKLTYPSLPSRVVHGDLKLNNVRFRGNEGWCLIDLDTLAYGTVDIELGDALRSWCNQGGENTSEARLSVELFEAAMKGYFEGIEPWGGLSEQEAESIPHGMLRVCVELSARFAADALNESYFGWDSSRFPAAGEHNLLRATGQFVLAKQIALQMQALRAVIRKLR